MSDRIQVIEYIDKEGNRTDFIVTDDMFVQVRIYQPMETWFDMFTQKPWPCPPEGR